MSSKTSNKSQCSVFRFPTRRKNSVWIFFPAWNCFFCSSIDSLPMSDCCWWLQFDSACVSMCLHVCVSVWVCERVGVRACVWAWRVCKSVCVLCESMPCFLRLVVFCQVMRTEFCRIPIGCSHLSCCSCCCSSCLNETSYFVSSITAL